MLFGYYTGKKGRGGQNKKVVTFSSVSLGLKKKFQNNLTIPYPQPFWGHSSPTLALPGPTPLLSFMIC